MSTRTEAQIAASRANGAKSRGPVTPEGKARSAANSAFSTGPRTPEGKARSSRNAVKQGMLASSIVLPEESREQFLELLEEYRAYLLPVGFMEEEAVEVIAVNRWRLRRIWCIDMATIAHATRLQELSGDTAAEEHSAENPIVHTAVAVGNLNNRGRSLQSLRQAEALYSREYRRARAELKELQAERREHETFEIEANLRTDDLIEPGGTDRLAVCLPDDEASSNSATPEETPVNPTEPDYAVPDPMHVHSCHSWPLNSATPDKTPLNQTELDKLPEAA